MLQINIHQKARGNGGESTFNDIIGIKSLLGKLAVFVAMGRDVDDPLESLG